MNYRIDDDMEKRKIAKNQKYEKRSFVISFRVVWIAAAEVSGLLLGGLFVVCCFFIFFYFFFF